MEITETKQTTATTTTTEQVKRKEPVANNNTIKTFVHITYDNMKPFVYIYY